MISQSEQTVHVTQDFLAVHLVLFAVVVCFYGCDKVPSSSFPREAKWVVYQASSTGIANNVGNCVFTDGQGNVWIGTDSGASFFSKNVWSNLYDSLTYINYIKIPPYSVVGSAVASITGGKDGSLWFGLVGGGVERFNKSNPGQAWIRYGDPDLPSNIVFGLAAEQQELGEVWVGTDNGIGRFVPADNPLNLNQGVWTTYTQQSDPTHVPLSFIGAVALNPIDNSIWLAVDYMQVEYYDIDDDHWGEIYTLPPQVQATITSIAFDNTDHAWVGTYGGVGVLNVNTSVWEHFYNAQDPATQGHFPNSVVNCVTTDFVSDRWFGTNQGLVELNGTTCTLYTQQNSPLPSDSVRGVGYDRSGNLWIATTDGVVEYNPLGTIQ